MATNPKTGEIMEYIFPDVVEDKCKQCGRCVSIIIKSDELDFDAPSIKSECKTKGCPINISYRPNDIQLVDINFVTCDDA